MTWQPIETAPKDKPIWLRGDGIFHGVEFVAHRKKPKFEWQIETWVTTISHQVVPDHCVTHWMPRTDPPA